MKRLYSAIVGRGIYQYEFIEDRIALAKWDAIPRSTLQWINIGYGLKGNRFRLVGTCIEDLEVRPMDDAILA